MATSERSVRLGRVETRVLEEVGRRGGVAPRAALLPELFPQLNRRPMTGRGERAEQALEEWKFQRADAESAISRAIGSLRRKGLLVAERSTQTGRTLVRQPGVETVPPWERTALREEILAANCQRQMRELERIAVRARRRATLIRATGSDAHTRAERELDLELRRQLADEPV